MRLTSSCTATPARVFLTAVFSALLVLSFGCKKAADEVDESAHEDAPAVTPTASPTPDPYTGPAAGDVLDLDGGVRVEVLAPGRGTEPLAAGSRVRVRYELQLEDGTVIEPWDETGELLIEDLGAARVVAGLDDALLALYPGTRARATIPPERGYGPHGVGQIPANSTLLIEFEIVGVAESNDSVPGEMP